MTASAGDRDAAQRRRRFSPNRIVLGVGALAASVGSIVGLGTTVGGWFSSPTGDVPAVAIQKITPITYGDAVHREQPGERVPPNEAKLRGKLITYSVETTGYRQGTTLPVRLILHDLTAGKQQIVNLDPIVVRHSRRCGCADFFLPRHPKHRYYAELQVLDPGGGSEPIANVPSDPFDGG